MAEMSSRTDPKYWRRLRAFELRSEGWSQQKIATALGVTQGAVSQWLKRAAEGGVEALRTRHAPPLPLRLSQAQHAELPALLARGAEAYGFIGQFWDRQRVQALIQRQFNVSYAVTSVGRILRSIGYSLQKPVKRAVQRDEAGIRSWKEERWPELKKSRR